MTPRGRTGALPSTWLRARLADAQAELDAAVDALRRDGGAPDLLQDAPQAAVEAAVRPGMPLVYLVTAENGSVALVAHRATESLPVTFTPVFAPLTRLSLRRIQSERALIGVRLVTAAACHSAATDVIRLPDETIGLPAGLLEGGAAGLGSAEALARAQAWIA